MKILVVLPRFPFPLEKGDKLRAYHQIVELAKRHEVYLFCVTHHPVKQQQIAALEPYCRMIKVHRLNLVLCACNVVRNWFAAKSLQMGFWNTERSKRACRSFARQVQPDVVYNQMVRTMPLVARLPFPKVMDFQDALSMNTEGRMDMTSGFWHYVLHFEFKMLRSSEYNAFNIFDRLTIISERDGEAIPQPRDAHLDIIPNGVDFDHFSSARTECPASQVPSIVFPGNMQYKPNVDAACFLAEEIMPHVWQRHPQVRLVLAGATPAAKVRQLASDRVTVTGTVADLRPYYAAADICVAPMRIGSGLQNKLLEAMAIGTPCVTTPLANESLGAVDGTHLLIGTSAEQLADAICSLLDDAGLRRTLAAQASEFVRANFSWQASTQKLEQVLLQASKEPRKE